MAAGALPANGERWLEADSRFLFPVRALRSVFGWRSPWANVGAPFIGALIAMVPALVCRAIIRGVIGEISSSVVFLGAYFIAWRYHRARNPPRAGAIQMSSM